MSAASAPFPLSGIIGIVDHSVSQLSQALKLDLSCVEIRADLLRQAGLSDDDLLTLIRETKKAGLSSLFTLRHADQGGVFKAHESERVELCSKALDSGCDIIDLEHGTEAASQMLANGAPMILSHHNFEGMLSADELATLSNAMEAQSPLAVKIIPTGTSLDDAASMLEWVAKASDGIRRIGFTMGEQGACSRIMTIAHGAPITYASFGEPVAPGQVDIEDLVYRYKVLTMNKQSRFIALLGQADQVEAYMQNSANAPESAHTIYLTFSAADKQPLESLTKKLNISEIIEVA